MIKWFHDGGSIMWVLLPFSLLSWCFIFERAFVILSELHIAKKLKSILEETGYSHSNVFEKINAGKNSAFSEVLKTICENRLLQKEENMSLSRAQLKEEVIRLQKGLTFLEVTATVAPMLGLLGTVLGMVQIFSIIAKVGVGDPNILAGGISTALNTTVFGLIIAIPALVAYNIYERKIHNIIQIIDKSAMLTLSEIYRGSR